MPAKPQYIHDLAALVGLLNKDVQNEGKDIDNLEKASDALRQELKDVTAKYESLKDAVAELRREAAVTNQKLETRSGAGGRCSWCWSERCSPWHPV